MNEKDDKITRSMCPALLIEHEVVVFIFNEDEIRKYPYTDKVVDSRRMIVVPKESFKEWLKDNYEDMFGDEKK